VLLAQDLGAPSIGALRSELGLEHPVTEVLVNWPGLDPGFLIVDALDAARDDTVGRTLRSVMREVVKSGGRWRVLASVREYDLRYGAELRKLFAGPPPMPEFSAGDLVNVRHILVSELTDPELAQVEARAPTLHAVLASAPTRLRELLRNPFNLSLAATLLEDGVDPASIRDLRTQMGLLSRYWDTRVIGSGELRYRDAREGVLRRAVEAMVKSRSLRVDRHVLVGGGERSEALSDLLRGHVLVEGSGDTGVVSFSHHMLFGFVALLVSSV
jgi:hypothetical protein